MKGALRAVARRIRAGNVASYDDEIAELEERLRLLRARRAKSAAKLRRR